VYAIAEGDEKPLRYPVMFRSVQLVVINKIDLLPQLDFDLEAFRANLGAVNPGVATLGVSARTGEGIGPWCEWLRAQVATSMAEIVSQGAGSRPFRRRLRGSSRWSSPTVGCTGRRSRRRPPAR
jgi:hypothetical protein